MADIPEEVADQQPGDMPNESFYVLATPSREELIGRYTSVFSGVVFDQLRDQGKVTGCACSDE